MLNAHTDKTKVYTRILVLGAKAYKIKVQHKTRGKTRVFDQYKILFD